jgi:hypothetical protein
VSTYKFVLAAKQYIYAPGWNSYCIGVDLTTSTVGLAINGVIVANNIYIKVGFCNRIFFLCWGSGLGSSF